MQVLLLITFNLQIIMVAYVHTYLYVLEYYLLLIPILMMMMMRIVIYFFMVLIIWWYVFGHVYVDFDFWKVVGNLRLQWLILNNRDFLQISICHFHHLTLIIIILNTTIGGFWVDFYSTPDCNLILVLTILINLCFYTDQALSYISW
jgi:hypothetical protein